MKVRIRLISMLLQTAVLLAACAAPQLAITPANAPPATVPAAVQQPTQPASTAAPTTAAAVPLATVVPSPKEYAQPAGCLTAAEQSGRSTEQMLAYAEELLGYGVPLSTRRLLRTWNAANGRVEALPAEVLALEMSGIREGYRLQPILDALHTAGFAAFLRDDERSGLHILAISLNGPPPAGWERYASAYWTGDLPAGDESVLPALRLTPCDWMVSAGRSPKLSAGWLEQADWSQPDLAAAGAAYLAGTTEAAFQVAIGIDWLENGPSESPVTMCGPLAWAISAGGGIFPPGYGSWLAGPKSFWLPKPNQNGRPWSLFPSETYSVTKFKDALGTFDFNTFPLHPGDIVYTYSGGDGFDHVFVVTETDDQGRAYAVSNVIRYKPEKRFTIERVLLYDPNDGGAGFFRNEWSTDLVNGRTGHKGFEVFRWNWRAKDIQGVDVRYTVQPGDTVPLVAARWRTPPEEILRANGMEKDAQLRVGQELVIPAILLFLENLNS